MGGVESPFGREFDSLADLISFGAAPAFLVHRVVLRDVFPRHPELGWFIASIYRSVERFAWLGSIAWQLPVGAGARIFWIPNSIAAGLFLH
jgi:CDP-diacylglycerol--serine O-phosphatidyltransferase